MTLRFDNPNVLFANYQLKLSLSTLLMFESITAQHKYLFPNKKLQRDQ
jgi:hypothetical protein